MYKVLAALRTAFLVFIIVYALWAGTPWDGVSASVTLDAWHRLQRATWIAIAWIAFETLLGWIVASFRNRTPPRVAPGAPEPAPPRAPPTAPHA